MIPSDRARLSGCSRALIAAADARASAQPRPPSPAQRPSRPRICRTTAGALGENTLATASATSSSSEGDTKLYADEVEVFDDEKRAVAAGNVVFIAGQQPHLPPTAPSSTRRPGSAPSTTRAGSPPSSRSGSAAPVGGIVVPQLRARTPTSTSSARPSRRSAPKKYKITNGGFSTCVQPTPRWDLSADTIVLNVDSLHAAPERGLEREGRAVLYLPVLVLPDQGRRAGDRLSDADLRQSSSLGGSSSQRVLLGDQPQPGRDASARLVLEGRPGL